MSKGLIVALVLIALVVVVVLHNSRVVDVNFGAVTLQSRQSLVLLGFFVVGLITGLLLKGK